MKKTDNDLWIESIKEPFDPNMIEYYHAHYHYGVSVEDMKAPKHVIVDKSSGDTGDTGETSAVTFYYAPIHHKELTNITPEALSGMNKGEVKDEKAFNYSILKEPEIPPVITSETEYEYYYNMYVYDLVLGVEIGYSFKIYNEMEIECTSDFVKKATITLGGKTCDIYVLEDGGRGVYFPTTDSDFAYTIKIEK